jgi:hypothetical protein
MQTGTKSVLNKFPSEWTGQRHGGYCMRLEEKDTFLLQLYDSLDAGEVFLRMM